MLCIGIDWIGYDKIRWKPQDYKNIDKKRCIQTGDIHITTFDNMVDFIIAMPQIQMVMIKSIILSILVMRHNMVYSNE